MNAVIYFDRSTCKGYLYKSPEADELADRWFGKYYEGKLVLELVEVAYLLAAGKVVVKLSDEYSTSVDSVEELVEMSGKCFDSFFWSSLSVFRDLRDRGRRVRVIEPLKFLVKDKSGELRLIYIMEEKMSVDVEALQRIVDEARRNNLKATLAIVSLQGELTYYDLVSADIRVDRVE